MGRFAATEAQIPLFDDTMRRIVSSLWDVLPVPRLITPLFDDTRCREVSSLWGVLRPLKPVTPLFDDTRCRRVSSLRGVLPPSRLKSLFLMILGVA